MLEHDPPLVNLRKVEWLIIDEADKLFEVGFFLEVLLPYDDPSCPSVVRWLVVRWSVKIY